MKQICINCSPLTKNITGIERFIYENLKRIDILAQQEQLDIVAIYPEGTNPNFPELKNIGTVALKSNGNKIKIKAIKQYLKQNNAVYVSLHGGLCVYRGSIMCTHDIRTWNYSLFDPFWFRLKCNINIISSKLFAKTKRVEIKMKNKDKIIFFLSFFIKII